MAERRFQEMPFGFDNLDTFSLAVNAYIQSIKDELGEDMSWIDDLGERQKKSAQRLLESRQNELDVLENRSQDMQSLFNFVKGIYDRLVEMEQQGAEEKAIINTLIDEQESEVIAVNGLIEHGLGIQWGYHFVQGFLALLAGKKSA